MPLYEHRSGERVITVPGTHEDRRLSADPAWRDPNQQPDPAVVPDDDEDSTDADRDR